MSDQSYTTSITVHRRPDEAFNAINNVRDWWETTVAGPTHEVGEEFTHWVPGVHYARIRVEELVPGRTVAWRVLDNWMSFINDQSEWKGTQIRFDIAERERMDALFESIGVRVSQFADAYVQETLFNDHKQERMEKLHKVIDNIKDKYGEESIHRGR